MAEGDKIADRLQLREIVDDLLMQKEADLLDMSYPQICEKLMKDHGFDVSLGTLVNYRENFYISIDPEIKKQKIESFRRTAARKELIVAEARSNVDYLNKLCLPLERLAKRSLDEINESRELKVHLQEKEVKILTSLVDKILIIKDSLLKQTKGLTVEQLIEKIIAEVGDVCLDVFSNAVPKDERRALMDKFKVKLHAYYLQAISISDESDEELKKRGARVGRPESAHR